MKIEIIFRAKRESDGSWVYGDLIQQNSGLTQIQTNLNTWRINPEDIDEYGETITVDPDTVGQFIGREDERHKKIFDGDIITVNGNYPKIVRYMPERCAFCILNISDNISDLYHIDEWEIWQQPPAVWWDTMTIEVIGNIYDNKQLLGNE